MTKVNIQLVPVEISLPKVQGTITVDPSKFPLETITALLAFGIKERLNNACGGGKYRTEADIKKRCTEIVAGMENGSICFNAGGVRGAALTIIEHACRNVWVSVKLKQGHRAADVNKLAPKWREQVRLAAIEQAKNNGGDAVAIYKRSLEFIVTEAQKALKQTVDADLVF
jgi:hypothetical protein